VSAPVLEIADLSKQYGGLRPLRVAALAVAPGEHVSLVGLDQPMAEVFVNLVTGASVADRGEVTVFGRPTSAIANSTEWLALVDRFGIVSDRVVLLEAMTVLQNLALPLTLEIEPPSAGARARAAALAVEVGLAEGDWEKPIAALDAAARVRVRLGRAVALDPAVLLLEHPTAAIDPRIAPALAAQVRSVAAARGAALIALTADRVFAEGLGGRILELDASTGRLSERGGGWFKRWRR